MIVRQSYVCGDDRITVRFEYNHVGIIVYTTEIKEDAEILKGEYTVPRAEVTPEFFNKVVNYQKLRWNSYFIGKGDEELNASTERVVPFFKGL